MEQLAVAFDMTFANRTRGGSQVYARSLFTALRERPDVAAWIVAGPHRSDFPRTVGWLVGGARKAISSKPPDILHCPSFVAPWRVSVPIVVTVHDAAARRYPANHPLEWRVYDRNFMPRRLRAAARVITGSQFSRREVIEVYRVDESKVVVVPYGIDPRLLSTPLPPEQPRNGSVLVFPGAPIGRKNLDAVLQCMARAESRDALAAVTLQITGAEARDFPEYQRKVEESGLSSRVKWLGHVANEDLPEVIGRASAVVYPSLYEGFGFPPLEAMALGTPVVASNRGSLPEVLDDAALLVEPTDDRALSQALNAVLTQPELRGRLRSAGRAQAERFTWARCADLTRQLYRQVIEERRAAA